jgi:3-oxoadipate enol-lactonase
MPRVHVNGIDLFYEDEGTGEPLLLLAGFACDHIHWAMVRLLLVGKYRIIRPDNRGVGRSDAPDHPYSIRQMAEDAAALLEYLGVKRAHVAGHSMGGQIAQELVLAQPDRVQSLMLLSTWAKPDELLASVIESWGELTRLVEPRTRIFIRVVLPWLYTSEFFATPGAAEQVISFWILSPFPPSRHGLYRQSQAILASDTAGRLSGVRCPSLFLVARQDILTPVKFSEELARLIPAAESVILPGGGHDFLVETPAQVAEAMLAFLTK